jgi:hypothetical protein
MQSIADLLSMSAKTCCIWCGCWFEYPVEKAWQATAVKWVVAVLGLLAGLLGYRAKEPGPCLRTTALDSMVVMAGWVVGSTNRKQSGCIVGFLPSNASEVAHGELLQVG